MAWHAWSDLFIYFFRNFLYVFKLKSVVVVVDCVDSMHVLPVSCLLDKRWRFCVSRVFGYTITLKPNRESAACSDE